jgi:hypothetical protein
MRVMSRGTEIVQDVRLSRTVLVATLYLFTELMVRSQISDRFVRPSGSPGITGPWLAGMFRKIIHDARCG